MGANRLRILEFGELPASLEPQAHLLDVAVGWSPLDFGRVNEAIKLGYPRADYVGVYAVEKNEIQSVVRVLRVPYTLADGTSETISAIAAVVTRRDRSGKGLARELLEEVHRREAAAGIRFATLWTGLSIFAHNLYKSMGGGWIIEAEKFTAKDQPR